LRLGDERTAGRVLASRAEPADAVAAGIVVVGDLTTTALYSYAGLTRMFPLDLTPMFAGHEVGCYIARPDTEIRKRAGGSPAASFFLLLAQEKETKEKGTLLNRPFGIPCVTRSDRRLRNSPAARTQTVLADPPCRLCVTRRFRKGANTSL